MKKERLPRSRYRDEAIREEENLSYRFYVSADIVGSVTGATARSRRSSSTAGAAAFCFRGRRSPFDEGDDRDASKNPAEVHLEHLEQGCQLVGEQANQPHRYHDDGQKRVVPRLGNR